MNGTHEVNTRFEYYMRKALFNPNSYAILSFDARTTAALQEKFMGHFKGTKVKITIQKIYES